MALRETLQAICKECDAISLLECGCLGLCGDGPNIGVNEQGSLPRIQKGVRNVTCMHDLLSALNVEIDNNTLHALQIKASADDLFVEEHNADAIQLYTEALDILGSAHPRICAKILSNRSAALNKESRYEESLSDAIQATKSNPLLATAWLRKAQALFQLDDRSGAENALSLAAGLDSMTRERFEQWKKTIKKWDLLRFPWS